MTYTEALEKSLNVKWKIGFCHVGEKCWCRIIEPEIPIIYDKNEELQIISDGAINQEIAEYIVKLHNDSLKLVGFNKIDAIELKNLKNP